MGTGGEVVVVGGSVEEAEEEVGGAGGGDRGGGEEEGVMVRMYWSTPTLPSFSGEDQLNTTRVYSLPSLLRLVTPKLPGAPGSPML